MPTGKYDHRGIPHIREDLHPILCRCGKKWGQHSREDFKIDIKLNCVACNKVIGTTKNRVFIPNQYLERYIEKGNYCGRCNFSAIKYINSSSFYELFKNKQK